MMMFDWLTQRQLPILIVLTKIDKVGSNEAFNNLHKLAKKFDLKPNQFIQTSALQKKGVDLLRHNLNAIFDDYFDIKREIDAALATPSV